MIEVSFQDNLSSYFIALRKDDTNGMADRSCLSTSSQNFIPVYTRWGSSIPKNQKAASTTTARVVRQWEMLSRLVDVSSINGTSYCVGATFDAANGKEKQGEEELHTNGLDIRPGSSYQALHQTPAPIASSLHTTPMSVCTLTRMPASADL
jgi:hypothetical protein